MYHGRNRVWEEKFLMDSLILVFAITFYYWKGFFTLVIIKYNSIYMIMNSISFDLLNS